MVVIFTPQITERLRYVCDFIFHNHFHTAYQIINSFEDEVAPNSVLINYSAEKLPFPSISIAPHSLLFQSNIQHQEINGFQHNGYPAFFRIQHSDYAFDIFAAIFFLISRYEEYLPHQKDEFSRYNHKESTAYKNNFLELPLVNLWLADFEKVLLSRFSGIVINKPKFENIITYDIDMAWSYRNKGLLRNFGGFLKRPSLQRVRVLLGWEKDPFDIYDDLRELHKDKIMKVLYFFLVAEDRSEFDKNISPLKISMKELVYQQAQNYEIALHSSWASNDNVLLLQKEKNTIEKITNKPVYKSRQHYLKFSLPETYRQLIQIGIKEEYSMGYGTINGFRASYAGSYFWFDLSNNKKTSLQLFPFCYMDSTSLFVLKKTSLQAWQELMYYHDICKLNNGLMITVFHNHIISNDKPQSEWMGLHKKYVEAYL
jgi:hypothetical protein